MRALFALTLVAMPALAQEEGLIEEGQRLFADYCAACHGIDARGAGPMRPALTVPAPDLTVIAADRDGFPHLDVVRKIDGRDPLVSHGSDMPVWGPFFEGHGTFVQTESGQPIATSEPVAALVAWLESVQR